MFLYVIDFLKEAAATCALFFSKSTKKARKMIALNKKMESQQLEHKPDPQKEKSSFTLAFTDSNIIHQHRSQAVAVAADVLYLLKCQKKIPKMQENNLFILNSLDQISWCCINLCAV